MNRAIIQRATCDFSKIKETSSKNREINVDYIINILKPYSDEDLYLFRDCIDIALINNK